VIREAGLRAPELEGFLRRIAFPRLEQAQWLM